MVRDKVFATLEQRGYSHAVLEFNGGRDEGSVDSIELMKADGQGSDELETWGGVDDLRDALTESVYDNFNFNTENSVYGTVTWVVRDRRVTADYNEQAYSHNVKTLTT